MNYFRFKVATLLGTWLEFLAQEFSTMLSQRQQQLPARATPKEETQLYWIEAIGRKSFSFEKNQIRNTSVACVESVIKEHDNMCLLKIKEYWDRNDTDLVFNDKFTKQGLLTY